MSKRQHCSHCGFVQSVCICPWLKPMTSPVEIIILQDSKERSHAKNTARLVDLALNNSHIVCSDDHEQVNQLQRAVEASPEDFWVFYPHEHSQGFESRTVSSACPAARNWIFLDGTWRKAYKLWHTFSWLQACQSFHFVTPPEGQYAIRRSKLDHSLSTLEAIAYALNSGLDVDTQALMLLFQAMQKRVFSQHPQVKSNSDEQ